MFFDMQIDLEIVENVRGYGKVFFDVTFLGSHIEFVQPVEIHSFVVGTEQNVLPVGIERVSVAIDGFDEYDCWPMAPQIDATQDLFFPTLHVALEKIYPASVR